MVARISGHLYLVVLIISIAVSTSEGAGMHTVCQQNAQGPGGLRDTAPSPFQRSRPDF